MVVDCGTAYLFYQSGEIGGGYILFVGIEANLSLLAEVAIEMVEEDLIYLLLVPKVVGDAALLVLEAKIHIIIFISKLLGLFIRWFETF